MFNFNGAKVWGYCASTPWELTGVPNKLMFRQNSGGELGQFWSRTAKSLLLR